MLIEKIRSTEKAKDLGKILTIEQALVLLNERMVLGIMVDSIELDSDESFKEAIKLGTQAQLCREAIQVSSHSHIL